MVSASTPIRRALYVGVAGAALCAGASPALAQTVDPFASIIGRARPENTTPPLTFGPFEVAPRIEAEVEAIDNVFGSDQLDVNDVALSVNPSVRLTDRRADRLLQFDISTGYVTYINNTVEDRFRGQLRGQGRFRQGTGTRPFFSFDVRRNDTRNLTRSGLQDMEQPLKLTSYGGNAGLDQDFGPLTTTVEGKFQRTMFQGAVVANGVQVDAGFRDFDTVGGRARIAYSVNPAQRFYVEGHVDKRDFSTLVAGTGTPLDLLGDRSSTTYGVRVGFIRQITELLLFDANVGYLQQDFNDPQFSGTSGYSFDASLFYSPTALTRFRLRGSRTVDDTVNPLFAGLLRSEFSLGVEHELRRDLILTGEARYVNINSQENIGNSREYWINAAARYYVTRNISVKLQGEHFRRDGIFTGDQTRGIFSLSYDF